MLRDGTMTLNRGKGFDARRKLLCERHAEMCRVFSHPTRLMILDVLRENEMSVGEVAKALELNLATVSPHLLMMKQRRVLLSRRESNQVYYRLANPKML